MSSPRHDKAVAYAASDLLDDMGIVMDDPRLDYVVANLDRVLLAGLRAALREDES